MSWRTSERSLNKNKPNVDYSLLCQVCGKAGTRRSYTVLSCSAFKVFFRRNALCGLENQKCQHAGRLRISVNTRKQCKICRFKKCMKVGMQKESFHGSHKGSPHKRHRNASEPSKMSPLDLFFRQRVILTTKQWFILSKVISSFDANSPRRLINETLNKQSTYPPKIRPKMVTNDLVNVADAIFRFIYPFANELPQFDTLETIDQQELVKRNIRTVGSFVRMFLLREADYQEYEEFSNSFALYQVSISSKEKTKIGNFDDIDPTAVKLFTATIFFSTSTDIIYPTNKILLKAIETNNRLDASSIKSIQHLMSTANLMEIQNTYAEVLFKYVFYRFGHRTAVLDIDTLIKSFLNQVTSLFNTTQAGVFDQILTNNIQK